MSTPKITLLPADAILVSSERQRKDPAEKHITELAKSISRDGLLHAIAVTTQAELISGFCRLSAIRTLLEPYKYGDHEIPRGMVPCLVLNGRDEATLFRLELEENLRRKNLTPLEEAQAVARLHQMLQEAAPSGTWTKLDTGKALDELRGTTESRGNSSRGAEISNALLLDSFAQDPDVIKAATKGEALRIAKKKLESEFMTSLGSLATVQSTDFQILEGDADTVLRSLPDGRFSGIVTDPPYGIDADTFGDQTMALDHKYIDDEATGLAVAKAIFDEGYRVCKEEAHLYMFCDVRLWPALCELAAFAGWKPYATPLIWHKPNLGHAPQPGYFLRRYECILFAQKGNRKLQQSYSDVIECPAITQKTHAAQKPSPLYERLMSLSFLPGEEVLDPCCGSGTIFTAASALSIRAVGIELNPTYVAQCKLLLSEI